MIAGTTLGKDCELSRALARAICKDLARNKERAIREELMRLRTHRMNVWLEDRGMDTYLPDPGSTYNIQITWSFKLHRIKPVGWKAPLP